MCTSNSKHEKENRVNKPHHLESKSPHVSRIFSAHSLETSPEPLSNGSSLSGHRRHMHTHSESVCLRVCLMFGTCAVFLLGNKQIATVVT